MQKDGSRLVLCTASALRLRALGGSSRHRLGRRPHSGQRAARATMPCPPVGMRAGSATVPHRAAGTVMGKGGGEEEALGQPVQVPR